MSLFGLLDLSLITAVLLYRAHDVVTRLLVGIVWLVAVSATIAL